MARYSRERFPCLWCLTQSPCSSEPQSQDETSCGVPENPESTYNKKGNGCTLSNAQADSRRLETSGENTGTKWAGIGPRHNIQLPETELGGIYKTESKQLPKQHQDQIRAAHLHA